MIHVLEVCESYGGGVKKHVDYLDKYLNTSKIQMTFLVSGARDNADVPDDYIQYDELSSYRNPLAVIKSVYKILKLVRQNKVDVIHAHSTIAAVLVFFFRLFFWRKLVLIYTPHAYLSEKKTGRVKSKIVVLIEKMYMSVYDKVINVSYQERQHALEHKLTTTRKQIVIRNGIESQSKPVVKRRLEHVVNIARCDRQKNPFEFIRIAQRLRNVLDLDFTFVGDGKLLDACRKEVQNLKLTNIKFVGFSHDVDKWLKMGDVFLSTSLYEGLPFSVIEAEAAGLPVLLTNVVGHQELYRDNGFLYELGDVDGAADWIEQMKKHTKRVSYFSRQSIAIYMERFQISKMVEGVEKTYEEGK